MRRDWSRQAICAIVILAGIVQSHAQAGQYERTFRQPKTAVEKALKELQPTLSGRLPAVEGFAAAGDRPLNRYQRAYYQTAVQLSAAAGGGTVVRVNTKVTAWYSDATPSRSGYQLLQ